MDFCPAGLDGRHTIQPQAPTSPCRVGKTSPSEPLDVAGIQVAQRECFKCPKEDVSIRLSTPLFQAGGCWICFCILMWKYIFAVAYDFLVE